MEKRGLSPVVATVLVILITVVAAMIIAGFVIPWIQDEQEGTRECFAVLGDLQVYNSPYNCYTSETNGQTGFSVEINNEEIVGFVVSAITSGQSDTYRIVQGASFSELKMLGNSTFDVALNVPPSGGVRTYVFNGKADNIEIAPILASGESCEKSDSVVPLLCQTQEVVDCIVDGTC